MVGQFVSGLADNALLIVSMAFLHEQGYQVWWAPLLKLAFTWSYVLLAPWVGAWADQCAKARLMVGMNGVKWLGAAGLLWGIHPLLAFAVVGVGASVYAPAKYGWITENVAPSQLVAANGWLEISLVSSVLLGTGLGGWMISDPWQALTGGPPAWPGTLGGIHTAHAWALWALLTLYLLAAVLNLGVPNAGQRAAQRRGSHIRPSNPSMTLRDFWQDNLRLWRDPLGGLTLSVTVLFWGSGAVMQFAVLRWAQEVLTLPLSRAAYLQAVVAVGVAVGAWLAGRRHASLARGADALVWGVALGGLVAVAAHVQHLGWAVPLLLLTGAAGGRLVIPMNALLQYRGHRVLSAGRSIAVQGFNENLSVLLMLGLYAWLQSTALSSVTLMSVMGLLLAGAMGLLMRVVRARRQVVSLEAADPTKSTPPAPRCAPNLGPGWFRGRGS
jgi:MFS family permease